MFNGKHKYNKLPLDEKSDRIDHNTSNVNHINANHNNANHINADHINHNHNADHTNHANHANNADHANHINADHIDHNHNNANHINADNINHADHTNHANHANHTNNEKIANHTNNEKIDHTNHANNADSIKIKEVTISSFLPKSFLPKTRAEIRILLFVIIITLSIVILFFIIFYTVKYIIKYINNTANDSICWSSTVSGKCCPYGVALNGACNQACDGGGVFQYTYSGKCCINGVADDPYYCKAIYSCNKQNGAPANQITSKKGQCCTYGVTRFKNKCYVGSCTTGISGSIGRGLDGKCECLYGKAVNGNDLQNNGCNKYCGTLKNGIENSFNGNCCPNGLASGFIGSTANNKKTLVQFCREKCNVPNNNTSLGRCCANGKTINMKNCNDSNCKLSKVNKAGICCNYGIALNSFYCNTDNTACQNKQGAYKYATYTHSGKCCSYGIAEDGITCNQQGCTSKRSKLSYHGQCCANTLINDEGHAQCTQFKTKCAVGESSKVKPLTVNGDKVGSIKYCCKSFVNKVHGKTYSCKLPCSAISKTQNLYGTKCCDVGELTVDSIKCNDICNVGLNPKNTNHGHCCSNGIIREDFNVPRNQLKQRCNQNGNLKLARQQRGNQLITMLPENMFTLRGKYCRNGLNYDSANVAKGFGNYTNCLETCHTAKVAQTVWGKSVASNYIDKGNGLCKHCPIYSTYLLTSKGTKPQYHTNSRKKFGGVIQGGVTCNSFCYPFQNDIHNGKCIYNDQFTGAGKKLIFNKVNWVTNPDNGNVYQTNGITKSIGRNAIVINRANSGAGFGVYTNISKQVKFTIGDRICECETGRTWFETEKRKKCYGCPSKQRREVAHSNIGKNQRNNLDNKDKTKSCAYRWTIANGGNGSVNNQNQYGDIMSDAYCYDYLPKAMLMLKNLPVKRTMGTKDVVCRSVNNKVFSGSKNGEKICVYCPYGKAIASGKCNDYCVGKNNTNSGACIQANNMHVTLYGRTCNENVAVTGKYGTHCTSEHNCGANNNEACGIGNTPKYCTYATANFSNCYNKKCRTDKAMGGYTNAALDSIQKFCGYTNSGSCVGVLANHPSQCADYGLFPSIYFAHRENNLNGVIPANYFNTP